MDATLKRIISKFEETVHKMNVIRSAGPYRRLDVTILGQQALLIRRESLSELTLLATTDFDAQLRGEPPLEDVFKKLLTEEGLPHDKDSDYIWLPDETEYETLYESIVIKVKSPFPIYLIVSKALKAPEKNKQLVIDAIVKYGDELLKLMEKYKVDISNFV